MHRILLGASGIRVFVDLKSGMSVGSIPNIVGHHSRRNLRHSHSHEEGYGDARMDRHLEHRDPNSHGQEAEEDHGLRRGRRSVGEEVHSRRVAEGCDVRSHLHVHSSRLQAEEDAGRESALDSHVGSSHEEGEEGHGGRSTRHIDHEEVSAGGSSERQGVHPGSKHM